jgi:hypothetical protein
VSVIDIFALTDESSPEHKTFMLDLLEVWRDTAAVDCGNVCNNDESRKGGAMNLDVLRDVLMWCTIINMGMLALSFLILAGARSWVYSLHSRWFPMKEETFTVVLYSFLGFYKTLVILFNAVPWIALLIAT